MPDIFTPDGFVQAQMLVRALEKGDYDVDKMITALEGFKFLAPKGIQAIRPQDHAMLQPMFRRLKTGEEEQPPRRDRLGPRRRSTRPRRSCR